MDIRLHFGILAIAGLGAMALSHLYGKPGEAKTTNEDHSFHHHRMVHYPGSCEVSVDGHTTRIELNQGMAAKGRWVSCQRYEGHPVLIYRYGDKPLTNLAQ